jgi:hypothetical protein
MNSVKRYFESTDPDRKISAEEQGNCATCKKAYATDKTKKQRWVACDGCDEWYHFECQNVKKKPKGTWLCKGCEETEQVEEDVIEAWLGGIAIAMLL